MLQNNYKDHNMTNKLTLCMNIYYYVCLLIASPLAENKNEEI